MPDPENQFRRQESDPRRRGQARRKPPGPWYKQKIAWFVWFITAVQVVVFIVEIVKNSILTHSPIEIHPSFNPMIGPSPYVLINMGARYVPCMRNTHNITDATLPLNFPCPNATSTASDCTLSDLCGFGGVPNPDPAHADINRKPEPDQWFRFIVPMFLHAGLIHIGFNMLLQVTMGREMEHLIGSLRFMLVYFSSGIFGFVFGGNFAAPGIASTGASGCLFGILALTLLDLLYNWKQRTSPVKELLFILADVVISFVLGLLPGLDNFSHIGGFLMGLALGVCLLHSPASLRERSSRDEHPNTPYSAVPNPADREEYDTTANVKSFARQPLGFFKGRKPLWWVWWLVRAGALVAVTVVFIILLKNFYVNRTQCGWCKYLSCLPIKNWCDVGNIQVQQTKAPNRARDIFGIPP
ncbi:rhomboid-domain-containing protein [Rhizodiscina lignyota]|uniref:Rhomboid-type serine protease n=1 Tax=Rhizodiscina lignyota TaxID=1504668 RepID=A0A9P4IJQ1_9PEZI|nr:rhomboid-domain-containing protein [Rhizodiscina lignyota]